jgi:hypothetical protein
MRAAYEAGEEPRDAIAGLGVEEPGHVAIDLAVVDARPSGCGHLANEGRDGRQIPLAEALSRIPGYALIGRRYGRATR